MSKWSVIWRNSIGLNRIPSLSKLATNTNKRKLKIRVPNLMMNDNRLKYDHEDDKQISLCKKKNTKQLWVKTNPHTPFQTWHLFIQENQILHMYLYILGNQILHMYLYILGILILYLYILRNVLRFVKANPKSVVGEMIHSFGSMKNLNIELVNAVDVRTRDCSTPGQAYNCSRLQITI